MAICKKAAYFSISALHIRAESFEGAVVFGMSARNLSKVPSYFRLMRVHPFLQTRLLFRHSMHRRFVRCRHPVAVISKARFKPDAGLPNHSTQLAGSTLCNQNDSARSVHPTLLAKTRNEGKQLARSQVGFILRDVSLKRSKHAWQIFLGQEAGFRCGPRRLSIAVPNCSPDDSSLLGTAIVAGQFNAGAAKGYRLE